MMIKMSQMLNSRTMCYGNVINSYICSVVDLLRTDDLLVEYVKNYLEKELNNYILLFLNKVLDIESLYKELIVKYSVKSSNKTFWLEKETDFFGYSFSNSIVFCIQVICDTYIEFADAYNCRLSIADEGDYFTVDIVYDSISASCSTSFWDNVCTFLASVIGSFCYKCDISNKERQTQYKLIFIAK